MANKHFDIWTSERSYRYKEEALYSHAPQTPGIYWIVTFDEQQNGKYVYVGLTLDKSVFDALYEHWRGQREPTVPNLFQKYPNLYFGFVVDAGTNDPNDLKDLYWALVQKEKPELVEVASVHGTGRYAEVTVSDKSIL